MNTNQEEDGQDVSSGSRFRSDSPSSIDAFEATIGSPFERVSSAALLYPPNSSSATTPSMGSSPQPNRSADLISRYRYYTRLDPRADSTLLMPSHIVPPDFFSVLPFEEFAGKQNSFVTVFSIWNTMMGTSLLTMPWALNQAGFGVGIAVLFFMGILAFYTAFRIVRSPDGLPALAGGLPMDFPDVCRHYWGRAGDLVSVVFSVVVFVGGAFVYWVLMVNFVYFTGAEIYDALKPNSSEMAEIENRSLTCDVLCHENASASPAEVHGHTDPFYTYWSLQGTVPIILAVVVFPLLNLESPTFFTKFNVLGTVSAMYLMVFVGVKASSCGWNLMQNQIGQNLNFAWANIHFPTFTGILALSYFIHNGILTILRNQKRPENNIRDLFTGYILVGFTYIFIATVFFAAFPLDKNCISQNFLDNFGSGDALTAAARVFLLFQMTTVLPLLCYMARAQSSYAVCGKIYPGLKWTIAINLSILTGCVLTAMFFPKVGDLVRFVGAFSGLIYVFTLPSLVHLKRLEADDRSTNWQTILHFAIIAAGAVNFLSQFVMLFV